MNSELIINAVDTKLYPFLLKHVEEPMVVLIIGPNINGDVNEYCGVVVYDNTMSNNWGVGFYSNYWNFNLKLYQFHGEVELSN